MSTPLRSRRAPCAIHGLAVADDGRCVRCRHRDDDGGGGGIGWPALFALGCCAAGLLGWQAAKMGPELLSLRPQHHLAVVSLEATSPVERLAAEQRDATRARRIVRPGPVQPAYAPGAVEVTLTAAEQEVLEAPLPTPVLYGGAPSPAPTSTPTKIIVKLAPPEPAADVPVFRGRGPADTAGGGGGGHRPAIPRRPVLLPPPGGAFPGGGTGELWGASGSPRGARSTPRANRVARPSPRRPSAVRVPTMRGGGRSVATRSGRAPVSRGRR